MRGGPSKQPAPTGNKGVPARSTPNTTTSTNQAPRNNDRHIPREFKYLCK